MTTTLRAERKAVAALFADLVGSTALAEHLDPEDVADIVGPAIARIVALVEEFGGTVKDLAGDGVLALFGAPEAHEDDAERAVRAALAVIDAISAYAQDVARRWEVPDFGVRLGIECGVVVLGAVGAGHRIEYGATGDAVNTASRLQSHAAPFTVLVGPEAWRLLENKFTWSPPMELTVKGKEQPVVAHTVTGHVKRPPGIAPASGLHSPLVGRDTELAQLRMLVSELDAGRGATLFVVGEPGLGKSRLLSEVHSLLAASSKVQWIEGRCASYRGAAPYWPLRELLRDALRIDADEADLSESARARCTQYLAGDEERLLPLLGTLIGARLSAEAQAMVDRLSPQARRFGMMESATRVLTRMSEEHPVLIAIEDLHWADDASLQLFERWLQLPDHQPVLLVFTHRPEPDHRSWRLHETALRRSEGRAHVLNLEPLPSQCERELLQQLLGRETLPPGITDEILSRSEGNPFYLEEVVRSLVDSQSLVWEDRWRLVADRRLDIPANVERVIISRVDRLRPAARATIQAAAVLGRQPTAPLLKVLTDLDAASLREALDELRELGLLQEGEGNALRFHHALIVDAVANNMLKRQRRELHGRAARAIEAKAGKDVDQYHGAIAHHYSEAGEFESALLHFELAGESAARIYAVDTAVEHFTAALDVARRVGSTHSSALALRLGQVLVQAGRYAEARGNFVAVQRAAREAGEASLEIDGMVEEAFLLAGSVDFGAARPMLEQAMHSASMQTLRRLEAKAAARLSVIYTNMLRFDRALELAERAQRLADELGDEPLMAAALDARQVASVLIGDMETVRHISPRLATMHRRHGNLWYLQSALFQWAFVDVAAGRWKAAEQRFLDAWSVNRQIGDAGSEAVYPAMRCWLSRVRGDYAKSLAEGRHALRLAISADHAEFAAWAAEMLAWTLLDVCAADEALASIKRAVHDAQRCGGRIELQRAACQLALALWLTGSPQEAREQCSVAESLLGDVVAPPARRYLQGADGPLALAEVHLQSGEASRAVALAQPVQAASELSGWEEMAAASALVLGRAYAALDEPDQARELLQSTISRAARFGMRGLLWRGHAAMSALVSQRDPQLAARHLALCDAEVESLSSAFTDAKLRATFLAGVQAWRSPGGSG